MLNPNMCDCGSKNACKIAEYLEKLFVKLFM